MMIYSLILVYLSIGCSLSESVRYTVANYVNNFAGYGDQVQFFYLQAPFPYNAPASVTDASGAFKTFGSFHGGLGAWNTVSNVKISIEYISDSFVGALFPILNENGSMEWNNSASIVITDPMNSTDWIRATLITTTSGVAWSDLFEYLQDIAPSVQNSDLTWDRYQPVTVYNNYESDTPPVENSSQVAVLPTNSYTFVAELIEQLNIYGCDMDAYLDNLVVTNFLYERNATFPITYLASTGIVDTDMYNWYQQLWICYNASVAASSSAFSLLTSVRQCYYSNSYAYIYSSPTAVAKIVLTNFTTTAYNTPYIYATQYTLPSELEVDYMKLDALDIVTITVLFVLAFCGMRWAFIYKVLRKRGKKRRIHRDGEAIAEKTVNHMHVTARDSMGRQSLADVENGPSSDGVVDRNSNEFDDDYDNDKANYGLSDDLEFYYYRGVTLLTQRLHEDPCKKYKPRTWGQWVCCLVPDELEEGPGPAEKPEERNSNLITQVHVNSTSGGGGASRRSIVTGSISNSNSNKQTESNLSLTQQPQA